jgi:hypothetical protein
MCRRQVNTFRRHSFLEPGCYVPVWHRLAAANRRSPRSPSRPLTCANKSAWIHERYEALNRLDDTVFTSQYKLTRKQVRAIRDTFSTGPR